MSADWADRVVINRRRLGAAGLMSGCLVLGVLSERMAFEWSQPAYWLPDLLTGLIIAGAGVSQLPRRRAVGWLLLAVAVAWFLGGLDSWARYWHRGPLLQLLFTFPIWRPRRRVDAVAVAVGWLVSLTPIIWSTSLGAIALSLGTILIAGYGMYRAVGGERSYRRAAFLGAVVFGASLLIAVVAGLLLPPDVIAIPALIFYEAGLVAVAVGLARFSPRPATDLVVELAESAPTSPPDALRKALGDRDLELGYWDEAADAYLDRAGRRVAIPEPDEPRQATTITRDQRRFAVLVHDRGVLEDARLADAVRAATQLTESNASLRAIVDEQLTEISASRQRLVIAGDNERAELERRLTVGPVRRVVALRSTLVTSDLTRNDHVRRASEHLTGVLDDLTRVGQGLHPRELDDGLIAAVRSLAERSPVPVRLRIGPDLDWPPQIATSAYYVCAEALTNVTKHAQATSVDVDLGTTDGSARMTIRDDGIGGVVVPGSGLIGISDRVAACGGRLVVADAGPGMLVSAVFPLETR